MFPIFYVLISVLTGVITAADCSLSLADSTDLATLCSRQTTDQAIGGFSKENGNLFLKVWDIKNKARQEFELLVPCKKPQLISSADGAKLYMIVDQRKPMLSAFDPETEEPLFHGLDKVYVAYPNEGFAYECLMETTAEIAAVAVHPTQTGVCAIAHGHIIDLSDLETGTELKTFKMQEGHRVGGVCLSPRGTKIACTDSYPMDHAVRVYDAETGQQLLESRKHQKMQLIGLGAVHYNSDNQIVSQGSKEIIVHDIRSPEEIISKITHDRCVDSIGIHPKERLFALRLDNGELKLYAFGYEQPMTSVANSGAFCFNQETLIHTYGNASAVHALADEQIISPRSKVAKVYNPQEISLWRTALSNQAQKNQAIATKMTPTVIKQAPEIMDQLGVSPNTAAESSMINTKLKRSIETTFETGPL